MAKCLQFNDIHDLRFSPYTQFPSTSLQHSAICFCNKNRYYSCYVTKQLRSVADVAPHVSKELMLKTQITVCL